MLSIEPRAYICAIDREICQVENNRELGCFFILLKKIIDEKSFAKLLKI